MDADAGAGAAGFGVDFGQKVDLTASIRNILRNYPEGTAILKELIQNADDAGAKTISFCYDKRIHPAEKLAGPSLAEFQGPALMVYNDAQFSDADFESIQRIGDSLKKLEEKAFKIGRFGIGFNSVYHLSELPSFVSRKYLVMLDPQAKFLPNVNPSNPGKMVNFLDNSPVLAEFKDQFLPYSGYGIRWKESFNGTLFRLPLRTSQQATKSLLSKRSMSNEEVMHLLNSLLQESSSMLLFLKNLERIEISVWEQGSDQRQILCESFISNISKELKKLRATISTTQNYRTNIQVDFTMVITNRFPQENITVDERWELCNQLGGEACFRIMDKSTISHMQLIPWGGVAYKVSSSIEQTKVVMGTEDVYCFLPLPIRTELPVKVNGFFELSSNRRDVWQQGVDMSGDGQIRADWNIALMSDILSSCYLRLLIRLRSLLKYEEYLHCWPSLEIPMPWRTISMSFFEKCRHEKILKLFSFDSSARNQFTEASWVDPTSALILPNVALSDLDREKLQQLLLLFQCPLAECSEHIQKDLIACHQTQKVATPNYVRNLIRTAKKIPFSIDFCEFLLYFCLLDINDNENDCIHLNGLRIIPTLSRSIGGIEILSDSENAAIETIISSGFSYSQAKGALQQSSFRVDQALEILMNETTSIQNNASFAYYICDDSINALFAASAGLLVNADLIRPNNLAYLKRSKFQKLSNIKLFDHIHFNDLLKITLPQSCQGKVFKTQPNDEQFNFFCKLWQVCCDKPSFIKALAEGYCVVPCIDGSILPFSRISNVISATRGEMVLPAAILTTLSALGVFILDCDRIQEVSRMPAIFWEYIHSPSRTGILSALDISLRNNDRIFSQVASNDIGLLFTFIVECEPLHHMTVSEINSLKNLPILLRASKAERCSLNNLLSKEKLAYVCKTTDNIPSVLLPSNVLWAESTQEVSFLEHLGVRSINEAFFFSKMFIPRIASLIKEHRTETLNAIIYMLSNIAHFVREEKSFVNDIKNFAFVPTGKLDDNEDTSMNIDLKIASALYDPFNLELIQLLDESHFPWNKLHREDILVFLRSLGLKTRLDVPDLLICARSIEEGAISGKVDDKVFKRAVCFAEHLCQHTNKVAEEKNKPPKSSFSFMSFLGLDKPDSQNSAIQDCYQQLMHITWVPIKAASLHPCLPWRLINSHIAKPSECSTEDNAWYCSASLYILGFKPNSELIIRMGWDKPLSGRVLATQLREISLLYDSIIASEVSMLDKENIQETISSTIPSLYQKLNSCISTEKNDIVSVLNKVKCLWVGQKFEIPSNVAFSSPLNAAPYLNIVPQDLAVFRKLLAELGVRSRYTIRDFINVLREIANETQAIPVQVGTKGQPRVLTDVQIELAISIVSLLSSDNMGDDSSMFRPSEYDIYIPDSTCKMSLAKELLCDDVPWKVGSEFDNIRKGVMLTHPLIANNTAQMLGAKSLRLHLINMSKESIYVDNEINAEAFGQGESLTRRLANILDMYPDGTPILSEFIQNADDAGATEVSILVDENCYDCESLLDSKAEVLQAPSLLFYNNALFSETDFRNLARIGQGSKVEKLGSTGRFGLGFNSCYHLTDTPTFVSGDYFVIFDPHTSFIPGTTPSQPGLKMRFTKNPLRNTFNDQCKPYLHFHCDMENYFNGTLFRFPLRNSQSAKKSEISKRSYSVNDLYQLIDAFRANFSHQLLFLRSIERISIYSYSTSKQLKLMHSVASRVSNVSVINNYSLLQNFEKKMVINMINQERKMQLQMSSKDKFYSEFITVKDSQLPTICHYLTIEDSNYSDSLQVSIKKYEYFIVTGLRGGEAKDMACDSNLRHLKLVPFSSIAICIQTNLNDDSLQESSIVIPLKGQAFSYLPLPVFTGLPIHVNAFFELSSNRRDIWKGADTSGESKIRSQWNLLVVRDVVTSVYAIALKLLSAKLVNSFGQSSKLSTALLNALPCSDTMDQPWDLVPHNLFPQIGEIPLFYTEFNHGAIIAIVDSVMLPYDANGIKESSVESISSGKIAEIGNILLLQGFRVAFVNQSIYKILKDIFPKNIISTKRLCEHFKRNSTVGSALNAALMLDYLITNTSPDELEHLLGVHLLPLESGDIGVFGSANSAPSYYYIVTDLERKILLNRKNIIAAEDVVGKQVNKFLLSDDVQKLFNILKMTPKVMAEQIAMLMRPFMNDIPISLEKWLDSLELDKKADWLVLLWRYILENKCLDSFKETFPCVPIMSVSASSTNSIHLIPFVAYSQCLNISFKDSLSDQILQLLNSLQVYIIHPTALGSLMYDDEFSRLQCESSAKGFLSVFVFQKKFDQIESWTAEAKEAFRNFLLDSILSKVDNLSEEHISVLHGLSIWKLCGEETTHKTLQETKIPSLNLSSLNVLDNRFVHVRNATDQICYAKLGLASPSDEEVYCDYIIQKIISLSYPESTLKLLSINILRNLKNLTEVRPEIIDTLKECKFIVSQSNTFKRPIDLFDPFVQIFSNLIPNSSFPDLNTYADLLQSLRSLGMHCKLTGSNVITIAKSIEEEYQALGLTLNSLPVSELSLLVNERVRRVVKRSITLLNYLDEKDDLVNELCDSSLSEEWRSALQNTTWIPVLTKPNALCKINDIFPPWNDEFHLNPLAKPQQCMLVSNIWLCSSNYRICQYEVQNKKLFEFLDIKSSLPGRAATQQLLLIHELYYSAANKQTFEEICYNIVPKLYQALQAALTRESMEETDIWLRVLRSKPVIWINSTFVEPGRVSFSQLSSINVEPYLYVVNGENLRYRQLFSDLGVKESFNTSDLMTLMNSVRAKHQGNSIVDDLDMYLGIVAIFVRILRTECQLQVPCIEDTKSEQDLMMLMTSTLSKLGPFYLPDLHGCLHPANQLCFDDAPWMSKKLKSLNVRFVYNRISHEEARILGARSLREYMVTGEELLCPPVETICSTCQSFTPAEALNDLVAIGDLIGATRVRIIFDDRSYSSESIMYPTFESLQGPSLMIFYEGIILESVEIAQLLSSPTEVFNQRNVNPETMNSYTYGNKLLSSFVFGDLLQVLSGNKMFVYDPSGKYLLSTYDFKGAGSKAKSRVKSKAQHFNLCESDGQTILSKFPDQFAQFLKLQELNFEPIPMLASGIVQGTIIHIAFRKEESFLPTVFNTLSLKSSLPHILSSIEASILFSSKVDLTSFYYCASDLDSNMEDVEFVTFYQPIDDHRIARKKFLAEKSWKKSSSSFLFQKSVKIDDYKCNNVTMIVKSHIKEKDGFFCDVSTAMQIKLNEENRRTWMIWYRYFDSIKSMVSHDRYLKLSLLPFGSIALLMDSTAYMEPGCILCGSSVITSNSGLPFHLEAAFLQDMASHELSLLYQGKDQFADNRTVEQMIPLSLIKQWNFEVFMSIMKLLLPDVLMEVRNIVSSGYSRVITETKLDIEPSLCGEVKRFYHYFPDFSRVPKGVSECFVQSKLMSAFTQLPLFLGRTGFERLKDVYLPTVVFATPAFRYLQSVINVANVPPFIAANCRISETSFNELSNRKLREMLKSDSRTHCKRLQNRFDIVLPLLNFCLADIQERVRDSELNINEKKRLCSELHLVPLLIMRSGAVKSFPISTSKEAILLAPHEVEISLPRMEDVFIHQSVVKLLKDLLENEILRRELHLEFMSTQHILHYASLIVPSTGIGKKYVSWKSEEGQDVKDKLILFALWNTILNSCDDVSLNSLQLLPLVPVVSKGQSMLLTCAAAPYLLDHMESIVDAVQSKISLRQQITNEIVNETQQLQPLTNPVEKQELTATDNPINVIEESAYHDFLQPSQLLQVLSTLGVPFLDASIIEKVPQAILEKYTDQSKTEGHRILHLLDYLLLLEMDSDEPLLEFNILSFEECNLILFEFLRAYRRTVFANEEVQMLKRLPLLTTVSNQRCSCQSGDKFWCQEDNVRNISGQTLSSNHNFLDLIVKTDPRLKDLYTLLGIIELTPLIAMKKFTLPNLNLVESQERLPIVASLLENWNNYCNDREVIDNLKTLPFIPIHHQSSFTATYCTAGELLSWQKRTLLDALGDLYPQYFIPQELRTNSWQKLLSDLGMKDDIDKDVALRIASDIEQSSLVSKEEAVMNNSNSSVLLPSYYLNAQKFLRYILDHEHVHIFVDPSFISQLKKITFVPVLKPENGCEHGFVNYSPALVRFDQCISSQRAALGFTVLPILAEEISPPQMYFSMFGILTVPKPDIVLKHLKNLSNNPSFTSEVALDRWNHPTLSIAQVFGEIFKYLMDNWKELSQNDRDILKISNVIPVGVNLLKPSRLFFRLNEDLNPFMHEVPRYFGPQEKFLKLLGVRESPSYMDYLHFLSELATECKQQSLNPNELKAVLTIIQKLGNEKSFEKSSEVKLFLPDENSVLRWFQECLFNDDAWLSSRFHEMFRAKQHRNISLLHPLVNKQTALQLDVKMLSSLMVETLHDEFLQEVDHEDKMKILENMKSRELAMAISMFVFESRFKDDEISRVVSENSTTVIESTLNSMSIRVVKELKTSLSLKTSSKSTEIRLEKISETIESLFFVNQNNDLIMKSKQNWINSILVNHQMLSRADSITLNTAVGLALCRLFSIDIAYGSILAMLLNCQYSAQITKTLEDMRFSVAKNTFRELLRGTEGTLVTDEDISRLELKPFRAFRVGEIVVIESQLGQSSAVEETKDSSTSPVPKVFKYAKVVAIPSAEEESSKSVIRRIGLKTSFHSVEYFLATDIYGFKSAREHAATLGNGLSEAKQKLPLKTEEITLSFNETATNKKLIAGSENRAASDSKNLSPVTNNEISEAIKTLLERAGLAVSLEKEDLIRQVLDLQQLNKKMEIELQAQRAQCLEISTNLDQLKMSFKCQICLTLDVTHVLVPCGHTFCGDCSSRLTQNKCPYCRSAIQRRNKFYLSSDDAKTEQDTA